MSPVLSFGPTWAETVPPQGFTLVSHTGNRAREKGFSQTGAKPLTSSNTKETAPGCRTPPGVCQHPKKAHAGWERAFLSGSAKRPTFCKVKAVIRLGEYTSRIEATGRITALCLANLHRDAQSRGTCGFSPAEARSCAEHSSGNSIGSYQARAWGED